MIRRELAEKVLERWQMSAAFVFTDEGITYILDPRRVLWLTQHDNRILFGEITSVEMLGDSLFFCARDRDIGVEVFP